MLPIENFLLSDVSRIQNCCTLHFRKKQISRSAPDVTQRLTIFFNFPIQVDFANEFENVLEKRQQFLIRFFFWSFLWLFVAFLCCKQQTSEPH